MQQTVFKRLARYVWAAVHMDDLPNRTQPARLFPPRAHKLQLSPLARAALLVKGGAS